MSITHTEQVRCRCGAIVDAFVADSLNAARHPHLRQMVFDRTLHVFTCAACGHVFTVEKELLYFDFNRRQFIGVFPSTERARERECGEQLLAAYETTLQSQAPAFVTDASKDFLVRIVFGYEELREKLVADDARLSDLVIEAIKCDVLATDGSLLDNGVLTLRLDRLTERGDLLFNPEFGNLDHDPSSVAPVIVERAVYDELFAHLPELAAERGGLASGPHCSLLRLKDWSVTQGTSPK
jgi:hypothetical protein